MFKEAREATFVEMERPGKPQGFLQRSAPESYYLFTSGDSRGRVHQPFTLEEFRPLVKEQMKHPVPVAASGSRRWWMHRDHFYVEDEDLSPADVKALIIEQRRRQDRRLAHAHAMKDVDPGSGTAREHIPDDVKAEVWNRYKGRCARCGSRERIEWDHVIPLSMGGSNTARNLQILCERCNRSKGARL